MRRVITLYERLRRWMEVGDGEHLKPFTGVAR